MQLRVNVTFPADSPRSWPIFTGYHPAAWFGGYFEGHRHYHSCTLDWDDADSVAPGNRALATLSPWFIEYWTTGGPGTVVELSEGAIVVATAEVLAVERSEGD